MANAGSMRDRFTFQRRLPTQPVDGIDRPGGWGDAPPDAYTCAVQLVFLHGTEAVQAQRLQGDQPVVITVRACAAARAIDTAWRAVDARDPTRVLEITAVARAADLAFLEILAVQRRGNADG